MYWQATMKDGSVVRYTRPEANKKGISHSHLDPAKVKRFEVVEGNAVVWGVDGMPRNFRLRHVLRSNGTGGTLAVVVLPSSVVFVFDTALVVTLPDFLPSKFATGSLFKGRVTVSEKGTVSIDGTSFPNGYQYFTAIVSNAEHQDNRCFRKEKDSDLRPDGGAKPC